MEAYEGLTVAPVPLDCARNAPMPVLPMPLADAWDEALTMGEAHGYRNAQVTVIAPTGTIGLVMDCDTTGIEPDFALVKFKKLAGGGYFKIINRMRARRRSRTLGYTPGGRSTPSSPMPSAMARCEGAPAHQPRRAARQGLRRGEIVAKVEAALVAAFDIKFVFNKWTLGEDSAPTPSA